LGGDGGGCGEEEEDVGCMLGRICEELRGCGDLL
jgi:hypothetical protein